MAKEVKKAEREKRDLMPWRAERDIEQLFENFLGRRPRLFWPWQTKETEFNTPSVDLYEEKDDIVVKAELPGLERDNIEVNLSDNRLTIKGEKKQEEEVKKENYYRSERSYGSFIRTLELPREVQTDKVKAAFKNGVLEIRLPKTEEAKKKETKVRID